MFERINWFHRQGTQMSVSRYLKMMKNLSWLITHYFQTRENRKAPRKKCGLLKKTLELKSRNCKKFSFHHTTLTDPTSKANYLRLNKGSSLFIVYPWDQTGLHFLLYNENEMQQKLIREYSMIYCLINRYKDYWQKLALT